MPSAYHELERRYAEISDLTNGLEILGWDQEVVMPRGGAARRAFTLATLTGLRHERLTEPAFVRLVLRLARRASALPAAQRRAVELASREVARAARIPARLAREMALAESRGLESWREARQARRFRRFAPDLVRIVDLKREAAGCLARKGPLYDALLDEFEPGATCAALDPLLAELAELTVPLVRQVVAARRRPAGGPFVGRFPVPAQRAFAEEVVRAMGIDLQRGRLDLSTHPFCSGGGPTDVRMTSRYVEHDLRPGLFGIIHEAGHGLYEQGLSGRRLRAPLGGALSMAIHESQSRLWENNVARSRPFWKHWLPRLRRAFPGRARTTLEATWRAANEMRPSPIRVEADELTYNLHIVLRYELERDLIHGKVEVRDLPERWSEDMRRLLGIVPRHEGEGVLQDIHWAMGLFGYFPTYSLGNLYAAQFLEAARRQLPRLDAAIARGDLGPLRNWLRRSIHGHDRRYSAEQLVARVTGKPLDVEAFRRHVTAKVSALYG